MVQEHLRRKIEAKGWIDRDGQKGPVNPFHDLSDPLIVSLGVASGEIPISKVLSLFPLAHKNALTNKMEGPVFEVVSSSDSQQAKPSYVMVVKGSKVPIPMMQPGMSAALRGRQLGHGVMESSKDGVFLTSIEVDGHKLEGKNGIGFDLQALDASVDI